MNIIEELYYGNLSGTDGTLVPGSELAKAVDTAVTAQEKLEETLSDEQKELFERYQKAMDQEDDVAFRNAFVKGFRMGMLIAMEVMGEK